MATAISETTAAAIAARTRACVAPLAGEQVTTAPGIAATP
jgi:hypothetical protein